MSDTFNDLKSILNKIDGRSYKAYKDLQAKRFTHPDGFTLFIDHVQSDPFAAPSRLRVQVDANYTKFPEWTHQQPDRRIGLETLLAKEFSKHCGKASTRAGSGKSGMFAIDTPEQEVIERTAVTMLDNELLEVRFTCGLPASGRRALGRKAIDMLDSQLPELIANSLLFQSLNESVVRQAVEVNEDAANLRGQLNDRQLVAFVADGAILPRSSGVNQSAMRGDQVIGFKSPDSLSTTLVLPNAGPVTGMGIPEGVTLIVGGGFHGKSTLLNAIERSVYNHCPDDGREKVASLVDTVKIRAEDGRSVAGVNISPFIDNLPGGTDTSTFSTPNASGSTSQAANIIESLEAGAKVLLIDEDIAATNFMIRDQRMQELVAKEKEPITPFVDKVRALYEEKGVSSILVIGGSGDYFKVADTVIMMDEYRAFDVTEKAHSIAAKVTSDPSPFGEFTERKPNPSSLNANKGRRDAVVKTRDWDTINFGRETIDLSSVSQIVTDSQTRAIASALLWAVEQRVINGKTTIPEILDAIEQAIESDGLDTLSRQKPGNFACFRRYEFAAALNRLRTLSVNQTAFT